MSLGQAVVNAILTELGRDADLARLSHLEDQQLADILEKYAGG